MSEQRLKIGEVSAALERAKGNAGLVLAHGAGGNMENPFLARVSSGLAAQSISTLRFNFPYSERGRSVPDRPPVLEDCWRAVARHAGGLFPALFLGGKSMGGRIASHVVSQMSEPGHELPPVRGLVFLGYPLHAPGKKDKPRDAHLYSIRTPMLFVEGTRDAFADRALLQGVLDKLGKVAQVHWIEGADHSFKVSGRKPAAVEQEILEVVAAFMTRLST